MVQNRKELIAAKELSMIVEKRVTEELVGNMLNIGLIRCLQTSVIGILWDGIQEARVVAKCQMADDGVGKDSDEKSCELSDDLDL